MTVRSRVGLGTTVASVPSSGKIFVGQPAVGLPISSQAEAEAGAANDKATTPLRVKQARLASDLQHGRAHANDYASNAAAATAVGSGTVHVGPAGSITRPASHHNVLFTYDQPRAMDWGNGFVYADIGYAAQLGAAGDQSDATNYGRSVMHIQGYVDQTSWPGYIKPRSALTLQLRKTGFLTGTAVNAELDCLRIDVAQDGQRNNTGCDASGIIFSVAGVYGNGFVVGFEGVTSLFNGADNSVMRTIRYQMGQHTSHTAAVDGSPPGLLSAGLQLQAETGTNDYALLITPGATSNVCERSYDPQQQRLVLDHQQRLSRRGFQPRPERGAPNHAEARDGRERGLGHVDRRAGRAQHHERLSLRSACGRRVRFRSRPKP
jgi:hypothetical protein